MRNLKNFFKYKLNIGVCIFLFVTGILKMIYQNIKIFINITPSIPIGLYFLRPYNKEISLEKRTFVVFPVPEKATKNREYYEDFIKEIVATYQDNIEVINNKIYINYQFMGDILEKDSYGNSIRTLKNGKQELKEDEYFVMGSNPKSYDSRYWGAVKKQDIMYYGTFYIPFSW